MWFFWTFDTLHALSVRMCIQTFFLFLAPVHVLYCLGIWGVTETVQLRKKEFYGKDSIFLPFLTLFIMGYFDQNLRVCTWLENSNGSFEEYIEGVLLTRGIVRHCVLYL